MNKDELRYVGRPLSDAMKMIAVLENRIQELEDSKPKSRAKK